MSVLVKCRSSIRHRPNSSILLRTAVVKWVFMSYEEKYRTVRLTLRKKHTNYIILTPFAMYFGVQIELLMFYEDCVKFLILLELLLTFSALKCKIELAKGKEVKCTKRQ